MNWTDKATGFFDELLQISTFEKRAIVERLARIGAMDVPGTPRLVMKQRSPEELAGIQQGIEGWWTKKTDPIKDKVTNFSQRVPTEVGKRLVKSIGHTVVDNPEVALLDLSPIPGSSFAYMAAKRGAERLLDRVAPMVASPGASAPLALPAKLAFLADGGYLLGGVGKPKIRPQNAMPPDKALTVKEGMIPTTPAPMGTTGMDAQKRLMKSQVAGTPEDKNSVDFKPLNQTSKGPKMPGVPSASGMPNTSGSITPPVVPKLAGAWAKLAFSDSGFGPTGGVFRPQYTSYLGSVPIPSPVMQDPRIKQGGNATPGRKEKLAFSGSGFGPSDSIGATSGNGGNHESYQGGIPIPPVSTQDPYLRAMRKKAGMPLTPQGRLSNTQREGQPKVTASPGPSIASTAKPVGFGRPLPGAAKDTI